MSNKNTVMNRLLEENIDSSIYEYIFHALNGFRGTEEEIAIAIYIKLAELFWYNQRFVIDNNLEAIDELYDITVSNNEIICLHWAIMYSKILDEYGIDNKLMGNDDHLLVKVMTDNFAIFADATKYGIEGTNYLLSDLTNTKIELKITGIYSLSKEKNKELDELISKVYGKLNVVYYESSKFDEILEKYRYYCYRRMMKNKENGLPQITKSEISKRIRFVNYFYQKKSGLHEVERLQIFSKYFKTVFEGFGFDNCRCITLCKYSEGEAHLVRLMVFVDYNGESYYYLETENGYLQYEKNDLVDTMMNCGMVIRNQCRNVLGFTNEEVKKLAKK